MAMRVVAIGLMRRNEDREDRGEEHEYEGLDEADEYFHEIKGNGDDDAADGGEPRGVLDEAGHGLEHVLAGVDIAVEPEAEGDGAEEDRYDLEAADAEEDEDHEDFHEALRLALWREKMHDESAEAIGLKRPDGPHDEEDDGHCERHVEVGIGAAEERLIDVIDAQGADWIAEADAADAGDEAEPIREEDEDEDGGEEPEGFLDELMADDALEEVVKALDEPLDEVLRAVGDFLHVTGGELGEDDDADGDDPCDDHGTGHGNGPGMEKDRGKEGKALLFRASRMGGNGRPGGKRQQQEKHR